MKSRCHRNNPMSARALVRFVHAPDVQSYCLSLTGREFWSYASVSVLPYLKPRQSMFILSVNYDFSVFLEHEIRICGRSYSSEPSIPYCPMGRYRPFQDCCTGVYSPNPSTWSMGARSPPDISSTHPIGAQAAKPHQRSYPITGTNPHHNGQDDH
jgi:hypothetical protein